MNNLALPHGLDGRLPFPRLSTPGKGVVKISVLEI
jgi:hypothetical protein